MTAKDDHTPASVFLARREALARVLGIHTVDLLFDRAVVEIGAAHPVLRSLSPGRGRINQESLDAAFASVTDADAAAALEALNEVMVIILARLLGQRVARKLAKSFD